MQDLEAGIIVKSDHMDGSNTFKVNGFTNRSLPWLILILISVLLGYFGVYIIIQLTATIFICIPFLYRKLRVEKLSIWMLNISPVFYRVVSIVPTVNLNGNWLMDDRSKTVNLNNVSSLIRFILSKKSDFFIIYPGIVAFCFRITFNIEKHFIQTQLDTEYLLGISFGGNIIAFLLAPIIFLVYFTVTWVWQDAGIKITTGLKNLETEETPNIWDAATELKNLIGLTAGISTLTWVGQKVMEEQGGNLSPETTSVIALIVVLFIFIIFFSGAGLLMGIMYYRSGFHVDFVNGLRTYISRQNFDGSKKVDYRIKIGSYVFRSKAQE